MGQRDGGSVGAQIFAALAAKAMTRWGPGLLVPATFLLSALLLVVEWTLIDAFRRPIAPPQLDARNHAFSTEEQPGTLRCLHHGKISRVRDRVVAAVFDRLSARFRALPQLDATPIVGGEK